MTRRFAAGFALALACIAASGCGAATLESGGQIRVETHAPDSFVAPPITGEHDEVALLREVVARVRPDGLLRITISRPTPAVKFASNTSWYAGGTRWLVFHYAKTTHEAEWVDRSWRAAIITTAYRRLADERDLPLVGGWTAREPEEWPESHGISRSIFARAGEPMTDAHELIQALTEGESENVRLISIELLRAQGLAPIVTLQADDPWRLVHGDSNEMAKFFPSDGTTRFEGALIRVLGPTGRVVWTRGTANWAGTAVTWSVPELEIPT